MTDKTCISCRYHRKGSWLSIRGDICTNEKCDDQPWSYTDNVTGRVTNYAQRHGECSRARISPCGREAKFWEPRA